MPVNRGFVQPRNVSRITATARPASSESAVEASPIIRRSDLSIVCIPGQIHRSATLPRRDRDPRRCPSSGIPTDGEPAVNGIDDEQRRGSQPVHGSRHIATSSTPAGCVFFRLLIRRANRRRCSNAFTDLQSQWPQPFLFKDGGTLESFDYLLRVTLSGERRDRASERPRRARCVNLDSH